MLDYQCRNLRDLLSGSGNGFVLPSQLSLYVLDTSTLATP
jgi:hypothetical protein